MIFGRWLTSGLLLACSQVNSELRGVRLNGKSMCSLDYYLSIFDGYEYRYIDETLEKDRAKFKTAPIVNPFLSDFVTEATDGGPSGNDGALQSAGVIGSMQGILTAL
jgi:hypothetical protein